MSTLIFVGGATASGKSTVINGLRKFYPNSKAYRRVQGFYDLAKIKQISKDEMYSKISSEEVDENFVTICKENELILSDVHYAVQINRSSSIDIYEPYVPTISETLIEKLKLNNINVIPIFLDCRPETCLKRAKFRFDNGEKALRNISVKDSEIEAFAEKREFYKLLNICEKGKIIDSENNTSDEIVQIISNIIYEKTNIKVLIKE